MISHVDEWLDEIDDAIDTRLEASGYVLENNIKDAIRDKGLIDTSLMINDVGHVKSRREVRAGTSLDNPNYPLFLNGGFRHHISGEIVGPYRFMESGAAASEGPLRLIWQQPLRG